MLLNQVKKYISVIKLIVAIMTVIGIGYLINVNKSLRKEVRALTNNVEAYKDIITATNTAKHVLELKLSDLSTSNDKMVQTIDSTKKVLKIKDKELKTAYAGTTVIDTTIHDTIQVPDICSFSDTITYNNQTKVYVSLKDSTLTTRLSVENTQQLFVYTRKEYLHKYKNFISRLLHFDFKKYSSLRYDVVNSNHIIKTKEERVIELID